MLSAIPVIGNEIVLWVWGGLNAEGPYNSDIILKILLNAGISLLGLVVIYGLSLSRFVKKITMKRQPAGVKEKGNLSSVEIRDNLVKREIGHRSLPRWDRHSLQAPQRLNARDHKLVNIKGITLKITGGLMESDRSYESNQILRNLSRGEIVSGLSFGRLNTGLPEGKIGGIRSYSTKTPNRSKQAAGSEYAYLVGLIEGKGWFSIKEEGENVKFEFGIEVDMNNVQLIYKIKKLLGIGRVYFSPSKQEPVKVALKVFNRAHLINIIFPIIDAYPLISKKNKDYIRFKEALLADIKESKDLPALMETQDPSVESMIYQADRLLQVPYYSSWLVGFLEAVGSFTVSQDEFANLAIFKISHKEDSLLIVALAKYLSLSSHIIQREDGVVALSVSHWWAVHNIIKFLQSAPVKLKGYRRLEYLIWLKRIRSFPRYSSRFQVPDIY